MMPYHHPGSEQSHGKGSKEVTFAAITSEFEPDDTTRTLFLKGPMEDSQDCCPYFTRKREINAFATANGTMGDQEQKIQTARTRRAWAAAKQNELGNGNHRAISPASSRRPTQQSRLPILHEAALGALGHNLGDPPKSRCPRTDLPDVQENQDEALDDLAEEVTLMESNEHYCYPKQWKQWLRTRCYGVVKSRLISDYSRWKANPPCHQVMSSKMQGNADIDPRTTMDEAEETSRNHVANSYLAMRHAYLGPPSLAGSNEVQANQAGEAVHQGR